MMGWIADAILNAFRWICGPLHFWFGQVIDKGFKGRSVVALGMAGFGLGGYLSFHLAPYVSSGVQGAIDSVVTDWEWLPGWMGYLGVHAVQWPLLVSCVGTFLAALGVAYTARVAFSVARAILDVV